MTKTDIEQHQPTAAAVLKQATTDLERYEAGEYALAMVRREGVALPFPRFINDFPWATEDDEVVASILLGIASAPDITKITVGEELPKVNDFVGQVVTVNDIRAMASDIEDARWGAFVVMDLTLENGQRQACSTGAAQVLVTLWRCWVEGLFPIQGRFHLLGNKKVGRDQPVGFKPLPLFE